MVLRELFLYFILPAAILIFFFLKKKFSYFKDLDIPHIPPKWPWGNIQGIGSKYHTIDLLLDVYEKMKGKDVICGFYNFFQPAFVVLDPELAKQILVKDFNYFVNRGQYVNEEEEPLTAHLFAIENDRWRFLRNKLSPAFTSGKLKAMYPIIINKGDNLVKALERESSGGRSIDAKNIVSKFTTDIISSIAFGMEANTLNGENEKLMMIFKEVFDNDGLFMVKFFFMFAFPDFSRKIHLRMFTKKVSDFFMNVVGTNIQNRETSKDDRKDFLNMLIQLKNKGSIEGEFSSDVKKLTLNEILAQAFLFFFAGSDTSSTAISFALCQLGRNPEVQERLREEILEKLKETKGEFTYEALHEMKYLEKVVDETLRMHNPALFQFRIASKDYQVPNTKHTIPKGAPVWINSPGFQHDSEYFPNPYEFDPERFAPEEIEKRPIFTYIPFGEGPRNCIGMRLGLVNVKLGLACIIKNFKVTPDPSMKFPLKMNPKKPFVEPVGGFMLKFEKI